MQFELTAKDGQKYRVEADSIENAQKAFDHAFGASSPKPSEARGFGSMLAGLVPGMSAGGWGPQNYKPGAYNAADAAVHGATFGVSDLARGYARDVRDWISPSTDFGGGSDLYPTRTEQGGAADIKTDRDRFAAEHPAANIAGNVAGGIGTAPLLPLGRLFGAIGKISDPVLRRFATGGASAGVGGAIGGVAGAVDEAPAGFDKAVEGGTTGLVAGGALGAAAPVVGAGLGKVAQKVGDYFASGPARRGLGVGQPALDVMRRGLLADDAFAGGQGAQEIARAGPYAMAVDAGPTSLGMLDEAISGGGPGTLIGRNAVNQRATAANQTLGAALDTSLGAPQGVATIRRDIRTGGAPKRDVAYEAAYAAPLDYSAPEATTLNSQLKWMPKNAIEYANELLRGEGYGARQIEATVARDGSVTFKTPPDVLQIDFMTRGLNEAASKAEGALGGRTQLSSNFERQANKIRGATRKLAPEYGAALDTATDDITRSQAAKFGASMLSPKVARDEVAIHVENMTPPQLEAVRQGIRGQFDEAIANVNNAVSNPSYDAAQALTALKTLNSQAVQEKLGMVMDPLQLETLQRQLEIATKSAEIFAGTTRNSMTAGRKAVRETIDQATEPGALGLAAEIRPWEAVRRAGQAFTGRTPQEKLAISDRTRGEIADLLTRPGTTVLDTLEAILPGLSRSANVAGGFRMAPQYSLPAASMTVPGLLPPILPQRRQAPR